MNIRYKLIISNKSLYKEVYLSPEEKEVRFGTSPDCDVRLRRELFFCKIELLFVKNNEGWSILCSENLYLTTDNVRKLMKKNLKHGDEFTVKYQESDNDVFNIFCVIDFDYDNKDYNRVIDILNKKEIKIGGTQNCDIFAIDEYLGSDSITLIKDNNKLFLTDNNTRYGVYINGVKISAKSEVKEYDFFSIVGYSFYYKNEKLYTSTESNIKVNGLDFTNIYDHKTQFDYPKFNRNTRIQYQIPKLDLEIQQPTPKPKKPKRNIAIILIPAIIMLAMTILLRGILGGGGTFVIYSTVSMSLGIITSLVTFIQENKNYKKEDEERINTYKKYIEEKREVIENARLDEIRVRNLIYESLENSIQEVKCFGRRLFEKVPEDVDFLHVYLGKGNIVSDNEVKYTKQEFMNANDKLVILPEEVANEYKFLDNAPVISNLNISCGVGVVGKKSEIKQIIKNFTLDIAIRCFYGDVKLVYILDESYIKEMSWIRWLHNVENKQLDVKNIICDDESKNVILENLYSILSSRENTERENSDSNFDEFYVVFVTDTSAISSHPISKYISNCTEYGFTFVFFEEYEENLPRGCTEIIRIDSKEKGLILKTQNGDEVINFTYPNITNETAQEVAMKLGAVTVDEVTLEGQLTKKISMFELLEIMSVEDLNLEERWNKTLVYNSMAAPLGVKSKNQMVYLDISDRAGAHGPHGLVAGTTGSGKSEIIQTYILSMASLFHPYEVGFVIIDFKGGGMANQFKNLPHLIGTITNIDGREINRSLLSIKAELVKRQKMFSECGVNHINDYIKLFKANKVDKPLPHLIMVVDEFAELKSEHPDFMKEIISAARIGRTLGIHLILATQKPAGVIDNQIWSNSKFKLCLKVQTKEDSNEVIKTPLAAEIVEPGRAYLQVGNNEIFDLFQSAYSGGNVPTGNDINENIFEIYERNVWGKKKLVYTNRKKQKVTEKKSQLEAIVEYVNDFCIAKGIERLPGICLPSLENVVKTDRLNYNENNNINISVPIGMFDDPEQQKQGEIIIEPSKENIFIVGSAQSGKTVMLQTIAYGLIKKYDPSQINIYLIDCGSMVLKIFENSKHIGGIVLSNEEEKCKNLFKLLNTIVVERKNILSSKGVGNFASYLDAGYKDMPMIVVVIDNIAAFKEYFPNQAEELNSLSREAQGVGISFIVTSATSNALNYRVQANFGKKLVLNCNDSNEYSSVLGHCRQVPRENAGSGLMMFEKRILEYQVAIFGQGDKEAERSEELRKFIEVRNSSCSCEARKIPMVPERLILQQSLIKNATKFREKGLLPIGMDFATVDYSILNLNNCGSLTLLGDVLGKEQFVNNFLCTLKETIIFHNVEAIIIDDKTKTFKDASMFGYVRTYTNDVSEGIAIVNKYCEDILRRCEDINEYEQDDMPYLVLLLNNAEVFKRICADRHDSKSFVELIKGSSEARALVILTTIENQSVGFNSSEVLKVLKEERKAILFDPLSESKMFDISTRIRDEGTFDNSMGYRFEGGTYTKIKIFE